MFSGKGKSSSLLNGAQDKYGLFEASKECTPGSPWGRGMD